MSAIETREYQTRALIAGRDAFLAGKQAVLFVGPTGCGKTTIFSLMSKARVVQRKQRIAIFAHRTELVAQAAARIASFGLDVGCNGANANAPVQVMSAQACVARDKIPECDLAIFDEAHHYVASEWHRIPAAYAQSRVQIVGFSATPERADGIGLGDVFDHLIVVAQIAELTADGFLVPCEVMAPVSSVDALACDPWEAVAAHAPDRSTVVFAPHIKAAHQFADDFAKRGVSVDVVHAPVKECTRGCAERRADTLARFAAGTIRVIVNVNVLTEGWDCPRAKCAVLARKYGSPSQYLQAVGRILRPWAEDPRGALLLDLAGNVALHGPPDEARLYSLTGAACSRWGDFRDGVRICRTCRAEIPPELARCTRCGRELPAQTVPTPEGVALERFMRKEAERVARAEAPACKYTKALGTLYIKGLRAGHKRSAAEYKYSLHHRPPTTEMRVIAWTWAQLIVARDKHDAWEPAEA